jgi:hypothetical protein
LLQFLQQPLDVLFMVQLRIAQRGQHFPRLRVS